MRVQAPLIICFVVGIVMLAQYFVPHDISQEVFRRVVEWTLTIGVFAFVLGISSLVNLHLTRLRRRSADWPYSIVVFVGLIGMAAVGLVEGNLQPARKLVPTQVQMYDSGHYRLDGDQLTLWDIGLRGKTVLAGDRIRLDQPAKGLALTAEVLQASADVSEEGAAEGSLRMRVKPSRALQTDGMKGPGFQIERPGADIFLWLFEFVQAPLDATMFSLLAFFIASATFRAFRARSLEATLLLVAASLVILGLTPPFLYAWNKVFAFAPGFPTTLKDWILEVPNMASRRAIFLGIGLGAVAQSFRIILGIERTYLGGGG